MSRIATAGQPPARWATGGAPYGAVYGAVEGGEVMVGNGSFLEENRIPIPAEAEESRAEIKETGKTAVFVAVSGNVAGIVAVAETLKPTARTAVADLKRKGLSVTMITGDNRRTAEAVAKALGIERVFAEVLPQDKADGVKQLQQEGKFVAVVGDGVNDAPALAAADVGIAIGAGTDVAIETASVVLMRSDPVDILKAIDLSKATMRKMKQNLFWASIYNVLAIPVSYTHLTLPTI